MTSTSIHGNGALSYKLVEEFIITFNDPLEPKNDHRHNELSSLWAVVYPETAKASAASFWRLTGMGISSRLAEAYLPHTDLMHRLDVPKAFGQHSQSPGAPVYHKLRQRIATMLERATIDPPRLMHVSASDVFLFPSGMSATYHVHRMLLQWRASESVIVGFPYELTLKMLEIYGPSCKFFSAGSTEEINALEQYLSQIASDVTRETKLQAIWCECPSNPLLWTPDLQRIRRLADQYDLAVVVDDTIGSSANVDVLDVADIVVTSLTKTFNGFADVLAGRYECDFLESPMLKNNFVTFRTVPH